MSQIDYLEEERQKLWNKIHELDRKIESKTSDSEKEARQYSKKASEYRNRCEESKDRAFEFLNEVKSNLESVNGIHSEISQLKGKVYDLLGNSSEKNEFISEFANKLESRKDSIEESISTLERLFEQEEVYIESIETLKSYFASGEEVDSKISTLQKAIVTKKKEIDEIHRDIFGYDDENEDGEEIFIEGLKNKLEGSYQELESDLKRFSKTLTETLEATNNDYVSFVEEKNQSFDSTVTKWKKEYFSVLQKIESLLPNALTAGLSYAYSEKKDGEIKESEKHGIRFRNAAIGLVFVSLIPFVVSIVSWQGDKTIQEVIYDMPRLVLAILPLYIPVLWLAYSANKKQNLSKRLIEEYTHKEVLSKTFEGLSTQIENIDDLNISADLRIKLLYNIINISSENPGKLISNYDKSDHPLTDALEQSVKLANAVEKLSDVPGLKKMTTLLTKKSEKIIDNATQKVGVGLDHLENEEEGEDK